MPKTDIMLFGITLFLDLVVLLIWKHRRDTILVRMNRGLRGYVDNLPGDRRAAADALMAVQ